MKVCSKCKVEKSLSDFYKDKRSSEGVRSKCKDCYNKSTKNYYEKNKEKYSETRKKYYVLNKEEYRIRDKKWAKSNKDKLAYKVRKRDADKIKRTPQWVDLSLIRSYYSVCSFFNEVNGYIKYHVDHVIPLRGKSVSGLHVHNNLQIILAKDNLSKGNRHNG